MFISSNLITWNKTLGGNSPSQNFLSGPLVGCFNDWGGYEKLNCFGGLKLALCVYLASHVAKHEHCSDETFWAVIQLSYSE